MREVPYQMARDVYGTVDPPRSDAERAAFFAVWALLNREYTAACDAEERDLAAQTVDLSVVPTGWLLACIVQHYTNGAERRPSGGWTVTLVSVSRADVVDGRGATVVAALLRAAFLASARSAAPEAAE